MIERNMDYLQFSAFFSEAVMVEKDYERVQAPRFYKRGYRDATGIRYYFGNPNSKKTLVVVAGQALDLMRSRGSLDAEILQWALDGGAEFSRLDLAVTEWVEETLVTMEDIKSWYKSGLVVSPLAGGGGRALSSIIQGSEDRLETFYIGDMQKRGKRGIFRGYDKGIELELGEYLATRLELEMRGEVAHNTALRLAETGDIAGNFRARFDVKSDDFERLMNADAVATHRGKGKEKTETEEKMDGRWRWLMEQVAPALREAHDYDKNSGKKSNRFYWFLREAGMNHEQIIRMVDEMRKEWENKT